VIQDIEHAVEIGFPFNKEPQPPNGGNVITEGFGSGFYLYNGIGELTCPVGWTPTWIEDPEPGVLVRPEYKPAGQAQVRTGEGAVACHSRNATIDCALYRQYEVAEGSDVTAAVWCLKTENALGGAQRIGIDPSGGVDHTAECVVWSDWYSQYSSDYTVMCWKRRVVEAVAAGETVTIFLHSKVDFKADGFNTHFDDLTLEFEEGPPTPPPGGEVDYDLIRQIVREEISAAMRKLGESLLQ
jgi:hypothetical protein